MRRWARGEGEKVANRARYLRHAGIGADGAIDVMFSRLEARTTTVTSGAAVPFSERHKAAGTRRIIY